MGKNKATTAGKNFLDIQINDGVGEAENPVSAAIHFEKNWARRSVALAASSNKPVTRRRLKDLSSLLERI